MAGAAIRWWANTFLFDSVQIIFQESGTVYVAHRSDFFIWSEVLLRFPVTFKAPPHRERLLKTYHIHLINSAMTGLTADPVVYMRRVAELGIIW